jgi:hypothetical protein
MADLFSDALRLAQSHSHMFRFRFRFGSSCITAIDIVVTESSLVSVTEQTTRRPGRRPDLKQPSLMPFIKSI